MQFIESQTLSPGATQQTSQTQQAPLTSQAQSVKRDVVQKRRKNKTWLWIFLAILACLIIVAVVTSVHNSGSAANKDTEEQKLGKEAKQTITVNGVSFDMVYVEGGTFTMGCTSEQGSDCDCWEKPYHQVTLSNYYIGETEVTQALWKAVMGSEPTYMDGWTSEFGYGDNYPAYRVSWDDVQIFIRELNRITGRTFRLPTEAEWEYAARGGSKSRGYKYSGSESIDSVAWYRDNSGNKTHPVKTKRPNELGLYDMSGNVSEWCSDWFGSYIILSQTNPEGSSSGSYRVNRGGSWGMHAWRCRVSDRNHFNASLHNFILGFRLVLVQ
ncbi:MAG: formylglycine-generating enzyme family protein [Bacteroidales bacterium]|nr:formylglycine-generating enzyme family protein [Bacteroidales bacterium]